MKLIKELEQIKNENEMFNFIKEKKIKEIQILEDNLDLQIFYCFSNFDEKWLCDLDIIIYECKDRQDTDTKIKTIKHWSDISGLMMYIEKYETLCIELENGDKKYI